jgi:alpha-L-rhamnosidase
VTFLLLAFIASNSQIGPINLTGKAPQVDGQGVQAAVGVEARPTPVGTGRGVWIWSKAGDKLPTRFLKSFTLTQTPDNAKLIASADVSYRLWINGVLVSRGPADVGRDYDSGAPGPWFDDVRNVSRFLKPGKNVIAAEVFPKTLVSSEGTTGNPGLKVDLNLPQTTIGTDGTWRSRVADDLTSYEGPNGFRIDATKEPVGWQKANFDDSQWQTSAVCAVQHAPTLTSELAPPLEAIVPCTEEKRATAGVQTAKNGGAIFTKDGGYAIRFPRVMSAYVALTVRGSKGARLLIMPNESDAPGYNRRAEILLRDGLQTIELPFMDSFSTINLEAKGVRSPITVQEVRAIFTSYPVRYRGSFECSDPNLNRLWQVCRWVTQICMQTHFLDSPHHQEPICDPGDYLIEALNGYYAFGDSSLARQDLRKYARILEQRHYQSFHTSYSLLWLRMLDQYWDYTGDKSLPLELAPTVHHLIDRFETYIGKTGLISNAPNYMFMDWVQIAGFSGHHPPAVIGQGYMTAVFYRALADDERIAKLQHNWARADDDEKRRGLIQAAFNWHLWDPAEGLYRDGLPNQSTVAPNDWLPADKDVETFSTQVNTLAVWAGLTDAERSKEIMQKVLARPDMNCQPYFMHFVFEAMSRAGIFQDSALSQIGRWKILPDSQSFFEMWDQGDRSHAWNATPLFQMSGRILGVEPIAAGFKTFSINPTPCGLKWAKGVVPTPFGAIHASWRLEPQGLDVSFTVPNGEQAIYGGHSFGPGFHRVEPSALALNRGAKLDR